MTFLLLRSFLSFVYLCCRMICAYFDSDVIDPTEFIETASDYARKLARKLSALSPAEIVRRFRKVHINLMVPFYLLVDALRRLGMVAPDCAHSST
jgi:hypothetical protein